MIHVKTYKLSNVFSYNLTFPDIFLIFMFYLKYKTKVNMFIIKYILLGFQFSCFSRKISTSTQQQTGFLFVGFVNNKIVSYCKRGKIPDK